MDFLVAAWSIPNGRIRKILLLLAIPVAVLAYFLGIDPILCTALAVAILWLLPYLFKDSVKKCLVITATKNRKEASLHRTRALDFYLRGDYDLAIVEFGMAISIDRYDVSAYNSRGVLFSLQRQYDYAIVDYTSAINITPKLIGLDSSIYDKLRDKLASAYGGRGKAYLAKEQFDLSIADLETAIDLDRSDWLAHENLGKAYIAKSGHELPLYLQAAQLRVAGEYNLAIAASIAAIQGGRKSVSGYIDRAVALAGKYDLALAAYNAAIDGDPNNVQIYLSRSLAYLAKGDFDSAEADFETVKRIGPDYLASEVYQNRDKAYRSKKNSESGNRG